MAFASRFGNLFKQAVKSSPSIYQAIRCMSSSRLFIGGLSYGTDDQSLREAFTCYGEVTEARVIMDRESGRSRGFGFVSFTSSEEANEAISNMDGKDIDGRIVRVNYATERTGGFRSSGGGGYGGGGGGGGGYGGYGGAGGYGAYGGGGSINYGRDNYGAGHGGGYGGNSSSYREDNYNTGTGNYGGNISGSGLNAAEGGGGDNSSADDVENNSYASTGHDDQFKDDNDEYANRR